MAKIFDFEEEARKRGLVKALTLGDIITEVQPGETLINRAVHETDGSILALGPRGYLPISYGDDGH